MNNTEKINQIIARRKGLGEWAGQGRVDVVKKRIEFFQCLQSRLVEFSEKRNSILNEIKNKQGDYYFLTAEVPNFSEALEASSPESVMKAVEAQLKELESLCNRFDRNTINISVIGRAGQGKSQLLQSISGVDNAVIPADKGGDCTGAKSVICNDNGETYANVKFFSEDELISNIQKYLDELNSNIKLTSISQVRNLPIDKIEENVGNNNKKQSYHDRLRTYVEHFDEYVQYLGGNKRVEKDEIREYVAQYMADERPVYKYMAVKEVEIHTPFVYGDAGKIMLVDTIGLGDTSIGLRDKMIDTLINDSDAAILLRRPDPERDNIREEDNELYDSINERMDGRDLSLWLFYVLNTYVKDGYDNHKTSNKLYESLTKKLGKTLQASFIKQLDCANVNIVETELIEPLLNHLSEKLDKIDESLIKLANKGADAAYKEIVSLNERLRSVMNGTLKSSPAAFELFSRLYKGLELKPALRRLNMEYIDRKKKDPKLESAIVSVLKNIAKHIPTQEDIIKRLEKGDASSRLNTVYNRLCDNLRSDIRNDFDDVCRTTIVEMQEKIKKRIVNVLQNEGLLLKLPLKSTAEGEMEWLEALISERMDEYESIQVALKEVLNYNLHIEGLLQFKVHCALDVLEEYSKEEAPEGRRLNLDDSTKEMSIPDKASVIHQTLGELTYSFAQNLSKSVEELLIIPNNSFNSLIRKLRESMGYGEDSEDQFMAFYNEFAPLFWKEEFDKVNAHNKNVQQVKSISSSFDEFLNKSEYMLNL